jgi:putative glycosyltransferase (TIGR04348 family)
MIVSPALARANNGNWQTASRWARFLRARYHVDVDSAWSDAQSAPDLLIALHARRSAPSLDAFTRAHPRRPSVLVLTGTDLYRDIRSDAQAQAALVQATRLVLLQSAGVEELPAALRTKASVIYQSAPQLRPHMPSPARRYFDICMIGHLRAEKDPVTFMRASALLTHPRARLLHIGGALEPELGEQAAATQAANAHYHWLGNLPHGATRARLKRCHAMVIASRMEGGANVIIEAVTCAVPVLASDISGNRGMLGPDYEGYFPCGDAPALARLIERSIVDTAFYQRLRAQCALRAALFSPQAEQAAVLELVDNLLNTPHAAGQPIDGNRP